MSQFVCDLYRVIAKKENDKRFARVGQDNTPVLNLKVVPYRSKDGDQYGTEWIDVAVWGKPAEWYQAIEHGTVVFLRGFKDIIIDGDYTNARVNISGMSDTFQPVELIRYDSGASSDSDDEEEIPAAKSVTSKKTASKKSKDVPF
jgi:hypothetical protein